MNSFVRIVAVALAVGAAAVPVTDAMAKASVELPAASRFYPFVGHWKGLGRLSEAGQKPVPLVLDLSCGKASSGWAVRCGMVAKNGKMTMTESDLMGVDSVTGTGHWYAVTNQGDTHDHITEWPDAHTMKAHYAWTQDGKKMVEHITIVFKGKKSMEFRSVVTEDGKEASAFSGSLKHN